MLCPIFPDQSYSLNQQLIRENLPIMLVQLSKYDSVKVGTSSGQPANKERTRGLTKLVGQSGEQAHRATPELGSRQTLLEKIAVSGAKSQSSATEAHPHDVHLGQAASLKIHS